MYHRFGVFVATLLALVGSSVASAQQRTLWMPFDGQTHDVGTDSDSSDPNWIETWVGNNNKGVLARTSAVNLKAGKHIAIFQIYHKQSAGKDLGTMTVKSGGNVIKSVDLKSQTFEYFINGGYQRGTVEFEVGNDRKNNVTLEFYDNNNHYVWLGAISIQPMGKPFFVIGHAANIWSKVEEHVRDGANAVEFDIRPKGEKTEPKFIIQHPQICPGPATWTGIVGDPPYTTSEYLVSTYLSALNVYVLQGKLTLLIFDCKETNKWGDVSTYAKALVARVQEANISADVCVFSVPKDYAKDFADALQDLKFPAQVDSYYESYPSSENQDKDGKTDIRDWAETIKKSGATFVGLGMDSSVRPNYYRWAYWLSELLKQRDSGYAFKKVYFWTGNTQYIAEQIMDYGADGIISDYPAEICKSLAKAPYNLYLRKAGKGEKLLDIVTSAEPGMNTPPPVAINPEPIVNRNSEFILQNANGQYVTKYYSGKSYYYPQVGSNPGDAEPFKFDGDGTQLKSLSRVVILTTNTGEMKASWRSYDKLGTFKHGVYYWNYGAENDAVNWVLEPLDDSPEIHFDSEVRIRNVAYNEYVYPKTSSGYLSTKKNKDDDTKWFIREKPVR